MSGKITSFMEHVKCYFRFVLLYHQSSKFLNDNFIKHSITGYLKVVPETFRAAIISLHTITAIQGMRI
jgi:hypothetical protein